MGSTHPLLPHSKKQSEKKKGIFSPNNDYLFDNNYLVFFNGGHRFLGEMVGGENFLRKVV
jgi:hypothetical protein